MADYDGPERRSKPMEVYGFDILAMIAAEDDPGKRIQLIVMNNLNNTQLETVKVVQNLVAEQKAQREEFERHAKAEEALMNQGRGMWRILAGLLIGIQGLGAWVLYEGWDVLKSMRATDQELVRRVDVIEHGVKK